MAGNIVLKTYKGGTVTPQNDAIVQETAIPMNGIFKGCNISYARGNVLRLSQGFGLLKGRFFEIYDCEVDVQLAQKDERLYGRLYVHMDLSNADEPIQLLTEAAAELPVLEADSDVNYNNSIYDMELATFRVTSSEVNQLEMTFQKISPGSGGSSGGGGGRENILRSTQYSAGDMTRCAGAPGWAMLVCIQGGETAMTVPSGYAKIEKIGDTVVDGTCVFQARAVIDEIDNAQADIEGLRDEVDGILSQMSNSDGLAMKLMSLEKYAVLEAYSDAVMYCCYYDADPGKIVRIFLGENKVYSDGVNVTYQTDTDESVTVHVDGMADAVFHAPKAQREGYDFIGWRKDTEADRRVLDSCVVDGEEDFTLYAVFKRGIEISMYPNGGTLMEGKKESTLTVDLFYNNGKAISSEVDIPECPYERKDMSFCGWGCGEKLFKPGKKETFTDDAFIVPEWIDTVYDFPFTGSYAPFTIPADGIYEFEVWGAAGASAVNSDKKTGPGGLGGHAKGYRKMAKGDRIYIYNGGKPSSPNYAGTNGGGSGYSYSGGNYGAGGGGATSITTRAGNLGTTSSSTRASNYKNREKEILIVAGGGGGGGITSGGVENKGGDGGGERGGDGSSGALGGRQISTGSYEDDNFGCAPSYSGSVTYSGGGGGWFGGNYGMNGNSGAGGSGYVGGVAAFTHNKKYYPTTNEAGVNEGNGYSFIRYVECV